MLDIKKGNIFASLIK